MGVGVNYLLIYQTLKPYWIKDLQSNWQCGGQGFESPTLHHLRKCICTSFFHCKPLIFKGFRIFVIVVNRCESWRIIADYCRFLRKISHEISHEIPYRKRAPYMRPSKYLSLNLSASFRESEKVFE